MVSQRRESDLADAKRELRTLVSASKLANGRRRRAAAAGTPTAAPGAAAPSRVRYWIGAGAAFAAGVTVAFLPQIVGGVKKLVDKQRDGAAR